VIPIGEISARNSRGCSGVIGTGVAVKAAGAGGRHVLIGLAVLRQLGGARLQRLSVYHEVRRLWVGKDALGTKTRTGVVWALVLNARWLAKIRSEQAWVPTWKDRVPASAKPLRR